MGKHDKVTSDAAEHRREFSRLFGSLPWLKARTKERYTAKVFKSGNSLALRLPAGLKLAPGMEMHLTVEDDVFFSFEPVEPPKRKFNIAKVAGSATGLEYIRDEDRLFEERALMWNEAGTTKLQDDGA